MNSKLAASVIDLFYRHHFFQSSPSIENLGSAGGFSGSRFWKITDETNRQLCLRRWPESATRDGSRLHWLHRQVSRAFDSGCYFVPVPMPGNARETLVAYGDHLWQLEPWMPGVANFHKSPNSEKLESAMRALASFHRSLNSVPCRREPSPGLANRLTMVRQLFDSQQVTDQFRAIESTACNWSMNDEFAELSAGICMRFRIIAPHVYHLLNTHCKTPVEVQTVIADVWHDHVLFSGNDVTGIVDFGAMRMDTPVCDVARLLGSLVGDDKTKKKQGLAAYQSANELSQELAPLIDVFDQSTTLMSGMNWLRWICLEGRDFGDLRPIIGRLNTVLNRMDILASGM